MRQLREKYALHGGGWGLLSSHPKSKQQNSRHFILSQFCSQWHGLGHYKSACWNGLIDASCPQDRTGTLLCGSCAAGFLQIHEKKSQLLAALALSWEQGCKPNSELSGKPLWAQVRLPRSYTKAIHSQSCSSLQGPKPLGSLWRFRFGEQFEGTQSGSVCASHLALQTVAWEAKGRGVYYTIIAHSDSWFLAFGKETLISWSLQPLEQGGANPGVHCSPDSEIGQDPLGQHLAGLFFIVLGIFEQGKN